MENKQWGWEYYPVALGIIWAARKSQLAIVIWNTVMREKVVQSYRDTSYMYWSCLFIFIQYNNILKTYRI